MPSSPHPRRAGRSTPTPTSPSSPTLPSHPVLSALARLNLEHDTQGPNRAASASPDKMSKKSGRNAGNGARPGTPVQQAPDYLVENDNRRFSPLLGPSARPGTPTMELSLDGGLHHPKPSRARLRVKAVGENDGGMSDTASSRSTPPGSPLMGKCYDSQVEKVLEELEEKRGSTRESALRTLLSLLQTKFMGPGSATNLEDMASRVMDALSRSIRKGGEEEGALAAKALAALFVTLGPTHCQPYSPAVPAPLTSALATSSVTPSYRAALLSTLAMCAYVASDGHGGDEGVEGVMEMLVKVLEGGKERSEEELLAAVEGLALCWTVEGEQDNFGGELERTMAALLHLLSHTSLPVRLAAGRCIGLICSLAPTSTLKAEYTHWPTLVDTLLSLARDSDRGMGRKERSAQRKLFRGVLESVVGSGAEDDEEWGEEAEEAVESMGGLGETLKFKGGMVVFDTWAKLALLTSLRTTLVTGLSVHFDENPYLLTLFVLSPLRSSPKDAASRRVKQAAEKERSRALTGGRRKRNVGVAEGEARVGEEWGDE